MICRQLFATKGSYWLGVQQFKFSMGDKLTQILSQRIDFNRFTLYENLTLYDNIIRQLNIDPTNPAALSAYELICRQYINPKTPNQSSKAPSSPQNTISMDINDPEVMGHFSFAKKPTRFQQIQREMKPERLFLQKKQENENKGLSQQIKSKHNQLKYTKNYVSNFQLPLVDFESQDLVKSDWKQKSRQKLQDVQSKQVESILMLKSKHFLQFLSLMRLEKKVIVRQLRHKSAIFLYDSFLMRKSWITLKNAFQQAKKLTANAKKFSDQKNEAMLQQYFQAWKQRALMSQAEKAFEAQIQANYEKLSKIRLFRLLSKNHKLLQSRQDQIKLKQTSLLLMLKTKHEKTILSQLLSNIHRKKEQQTKYNQLCSSIKLRETQLCLRLMRKLKLREQIRQNNSIKKAQRYVYGFNLIKKLRIDYEISKVYWKNPQKILFLKMTFEAISDSLSRQGYKHSWMSQLPVCLEKTDRKLKNFQKSYRLSRVFSALKKYLSYEKQKINEVKALLGRRVLKQLIANYKIQMLKEKQSCQVEMVTDILYRNKVSNGFQLFLDYVDNNSSKKGALLSQKLMQVRVKNSFTFLNENRLAKRYYRQKLQNFQLNLEENILRKVFNGFKEITLTEIVNKRIVKQYRDYRNIVLRQAIFVCLKQLTSEQKLLKRRLQNLRKLRLRSYFSILSFNMRVAMYGNHKQRNRELKTRQTKAKQRLQMQQCGYFFSCFRKCKIGQLICSKIDSQYQHRLKYKAFAILQTIRRTRAQQQMKIDTIKQKSERNSKKVAMAAFVNTFLLILLLKNAEKIAKKVLLKQTLLKMQLLLAPNQDQNE